MPARMPKRKFCINSVCVTCDMHPAKVRLRHLRRDFMHTGIWKREENSVRMATNVRACGGGIHPRRVKAFWLASLLLGLAGNAAAQSGTWSNLTEYPFPTVEGGSVGIAAGPDGALWFTDRGNKIGRITTAGVITLYPVPTAFSAPNGIAAG